MSLALQSLDLLTELCVFGEMLLYTNDVFDIEKMIWHEHITNGDNCFHFASRLTSGQHFELYVR